MLQRIPWDGDDCLMVAQTGISDREYQNRADFVGCELFALCGRVRGNRAASGGRRIAGESKIWTGAAAKGTIGRVKDRASVGLKIGCQ